MSKITIKGKHPSFILQFDKKGEQQLEVVRGLSYHYEMFALFGLINVGQAAQRLGVTLNNGKSTFFDYRIPTINVGIPEVAMHLFNKFKNGSFISYDNDIDYSLLAKAFYRLGRIPELASYDFTAKGDLVLTDSTKNPNSIFEESVRIINIGQF